MIANIKVWLTIVGFVVVVVVGVGRGAWWRRMTPWVDDRGPVCWVHVASGDAEHVGGRWRGGDGDAWRSLSFHGEGAGRAWAKIPVLGGPPTCVGGACELAPMANDEPLEVVVVVDGDEQRAHGVVRRREHYRLTGDAIEPEPSLWGVPLYAWLPW